MLVLRMQNVDEQSCINMTNKMNSLGKVNGSIFMVFPFSIHHRVIEHPAFACGQLLDCSNLLLRRFDTLNAPTSHTSPIRL